MGMKCPYCDTEINEKRLEAEDGCCPECGAFLSVMDIISDEEEDEKDDYDGDYDDDGNGDDDSGSYGGRGRDDYEMDEFDKFWEEEERLERNRRRESNNSK